jgi:hypothetical protein
LGDGSLEQGGRGQTELGPPLSAVVPAGNGVRVPYFVSRRFEHTHAFHRAGVALLATMPFITLLSTHRHQQFLRPRPHGRGMHHTHTHTHARARACTHTHTCTHTHVHTHTHPARGHSLTLPCARFRREYVNTAWVPKTKLVVFDFDKTITNKHTGGSVQLPAFVSVAVY